LFFCQLAANGWSSSITRALQRLLISLGWTMLQFNLPKGECSKSGRKSSARWHDCNHPKLDGAIDIVSRLVLQMGVPQGGRVLVLGDSTSTHCIDRQSWYPDHVRVKMQESVLRWTGVNIVHRGVSGTSFTGRNSFHSVLADLEATGEYDAVLLIGGWNQKVWDFKSAKDIGGYFTPVLSSFTAACTVAVR